MPRDDSRTRSSSPALPYRGSSQRRTPRRSEIGWSSRDNRSDDHKEFNMDNNRSWKRSPSRQYHTPKTSRRSRSPRMTPSSRGSGSRVARPSRSRSPRKIPSSQPPKSQVSVLEMDPKWIDNSDYFDELDVSDITVLHQIVPGMLVAHHAFGEGQFVAELRVEVIGIVYPFLIHLQDTHLRLWRLAVRIFSWRARS